MSARFVSLGAVSATSACLLLAAVMPVPAADYLRPEWQVGQDQVSPDSLQVIVPPPAPAQLKLEEAIQFALRQNLGFRRTIQGLLSARSNWLVARQRWSLEVFGSIQRVSNDETTDQSQGGAAFFYAAITGADFSVTAELNRLDTEEDERILTATLRQPLLAGSGRASAVYEEVRRAGNGYRAALLSFFDDRQGLIERVVSAYFDAVQQQQLVTIQEFSVTLAEQAVKDAQLRLEAGLIAEIDLTRAQLRLAREQTAAVSQRQGHQDSTDRLLSLLGLQVGGVPELVTSVTYQPQPLDLDGSVSQALELRPDLRLADLTIENGEATLRISRSQRLPTLDLFGGLARQRDGVEDRSWNAGLELSVPIASSSLREAVRQAQWDLLVSRQARENLRQQVVVDVRSQVRAAEAARANVDIAEQSLELSRRSLHIAQRMVEEGLRTNRDLLDAQDDLTRSEISLVTSKIGYYLALIRLRVAIGQDVLPYVIEAATAGTQGTKQPPAAAPEGQAAPAPPADTAPQPPADQG